MVSRYTLILLLVVSCCLSGCVIPTDRQIAAQIADTIRAQIHPQSLKVVVHRTSSFTSKIRTLDITISGFHVEALPTTLSGATAKGGVTMVDAPAMARNTAKSHMIQVENTHVVCENFTVQQLPVKSIDLKFHNMQVPLECAQSGQLVIASAESALGSAVFDEAGLAAFLQTRKLPVSHPTIQLTKDGCVVSGRYRAFGNVPVEVSGNLLAKNKAVLYLEHPKLRVSEVPIPDFVTAQLLKEINPLADLNSDLKLPAPLTIINVTHGEGTLRVDGQMVFPKPE
ncbi:MAG TPA: hypothetical protein VGL77_20455 [Armatimonadota bacterium]|jgi:hypothetical protein